MESIALEIPPSTAVAAVAATAAAEAADGQETQVLTPQAMDTELATPAGDSTVVAPMAREPAELEVSATQPPSASAAVAAARVPTPGGSQAIPSASGMQSAAETQPAAHAPEEAERRYAAIAPVQPLRDFSSPCWDFLDTVDVSEEFKVDVPTFRHIPGGAREAFVQASAELCNAVLRAPVGSVCEDRAWKLLLLRERLLLSAPLRHAKRGRRLQELEQGAKARLVRERIAAFHRGGWQQLLQAAGESGRTLARARRADPSERDQSSVADEVVRKVLAEEYSKAAALLSSPGLAPPTPETAGLLQDLIQPGPRRPPPDSRSEVVGEQELFSEQTFRKILKSSPRGRGAAVGGGRFEHWKCMTYSPGGLAALHLVCERLAQGRVPASAAKAIGISKVTPLRKPGGGVRPIAAPNILRRLAGKCLVQPRKADLARALGKQQFAIGTAAGTELLAHSVRAVAEADPSLVFVALDAKNAYCSAKREVCLGELQAIAPELLPFAEVFGCRTSRYLFWDSHGKCHELTACDGVDQGDPMAPLLFACGMRPCLQQLERRLRERAEQLGLQPGRIKVFAFLDDVLVVVPPELAKEAQQEADECLAVLGLELQAHKTQVWSPGAACPAGLERQWRADGLTIVGVPLGDPLPDDSMPDFEDGHRVDVGTPSFSAQHCAGVCSRASALLERIVDLPAHASPHQPAVQAAALLLRMCGASKINHLLRTTPPQVVRSAAAEFDDALLAAYEEVAKLDPLTADQRYQCQLPIRLGGRGLRSQHSLAPAAWLGSWAQCLSEVRARTDLPCLDDLGTCLLPLAVACREAAAGLSSSSPDQPPMDWTALVARPHLKLQKLLSMNLDKKHRGDLLSRADEEGCARLRSCAGPFSGGWQLASPASPSERLDDADYLLTARSLLGQAVAPPHIRTCGNRAVSGPRAGGPCGEPICAAAHHSYRCPRGGGLVSRSADVEKVWEDIHKDCGFHTARQVHVPAWDRWKWACPDCTTSHATHHPGACHHCGAARVRLREEAILDIEVQSSQCPRLYFDVTVRHSVPGDAARLRAAASRDGAVNSEAEGDKFLRYPTGVTPWRMVPLAVETYGRLGTLALKHLRRLAREEVAKFGGHEVWTAHHLMARWGARLSVALHRANARNARAALRRVGLVAEPWLERDVCC